MENTCFFPEHRDSEMNGVISGQTEILRSFILSLGNVDSDKDGSSITSDFHTMIWFHLEEMLLYERAR
jgi:hypothetical protein